MSSSVCKPSAPLHVSCTNRFLNQYNDEYELRLTGIQEMPTLPLFFRFLPTAPAKLKEYYRDVGNLSVVTRLIWVAMPTNLADGQHTIRLYGQPFASNTCYVYNRHTVVNMLGSELYDMPMSFQSGDSNRFFYGASSTGGGWKWLSWFGYYAEGQINFGNQLWINHLQHGWMLASGYYANNMWFWTPDMGWLWTSRTVYPNLYRLRDGQWLWYQKESINPRWFMNYSTGQWEKR